jgi:hypothetical protein
MSEIISKLLEPKICYGCGKKIPLREAKIYRKPKFNVAGNPVFYDIHYLCKECYLRQLEAEKAMLEFQIEMVKKQI